MAAGSGAARHPARPRDRAGHPAGQPTCDEHARAGTDRYLTVGGPPADAVRVAVGARAIEDPLARAAAPEISAARRTL
jgi:hypothetical protein